MDRVPTPPRRLTLDDIERARIRRRLGQLARSSGKAAPAHPAPVSRVAREHRAAVIRDLRRLGWTYSAIGLVVELSRQRVAQIDHASADRSGRQHSTGR